ncbi:hypothetical protein AKJ16_DCAP21961 [Drosera capensis]
MSSEPPSDLYGNVKFPLLRLLVAIPAGEGLSLAAVKHRVAETEEKEREKEKERSRNEKKGLARQSVKWGMGLALFRVAQIKQILSVASLGEDVFEALILAKLLRDVDPELLGALIQATKVGDMKTLEDLAGSKQLVDEDEDKQ